MGKKGNLCTPFLDLKIPRNKAGNAKKKNKNKVNVQDRNENCTKKKNKDQQGIYATVMQLHTKTAGRDGKDCIVGFGHPNGFLAEKPA